MKTKCLAQEIRSHLARRQRAVGKIPQRLFAARGLVDSLDFSILIMHLDQECVVGTKHELAFEFNLPLAERFFDVEVRRW